MLDCFSTDSWLDSPGRSSQQCNSLCCYCSVKRRSTLVGYRISIFKHQYSLIKHSVWTKYHVKLAKCCLVQGATETVSDFSENSIRKHHMIILVLWGNLERKQLEFKLDPKASMSKFVGRERMFLFPGPAQTSKARAGRRRAHYFSIYQKSHL